MNIVLFLLLTIFAATPLRAEPAPVRIGVLTDMSSGMAGAAGFGSVEAAQLAVEDFWKQQTAEKGTAPKVVLINADYQNRADLAQHISESWLRQQGIQAVVDVPNPAIAQKLESLFHEEDRLLLSSCRGAAMREQACSGNSFSWLYDGATLTQNLIAALLAENKKRWFILGSDDMPGAHIVRHAKAAIAKGGGELAGEAFLGRRMNGLSMVLEQIGKGHADVVFMAFERPDILHLLRNWPQTPSLPPLALSPLYITDVHDLQEKGLPAFYTISPFYWAQNEASSAWAKKFARRSRGAMPSELQASTYAAVKHYLAAQQDEGVRPSDILAHFRAGPLEDPLFGTSHVRTDGLVLHRLHLLAYLPPENRDGPWDYFKIVRSMPPGELQLPETVKCTDKR